MVEAGESDDDTVALGSIERVEADAGKVDAGKVDAGNVDEKEMGAVDAVA